MVRPPDIPGTERKANKVGLRASRLERRIIGSGDQPLIYAFSDAFGSLTNITTDGSGLYNIDIATSDADGVDTVISGSSGVNAWQIVTAGIYLVSARIANLFLEGAVAGTHTLQLKSATAPGTLAQEGVSAMEWNEDLALGKQHLFSPSFTCIAPFDAGTEIGFFINGPDASSQVWAELAFFEIVKLDTTAGGSVAGGFDGGGP